MQLIHAQLQQHWTPSRQRLTATWLTIVLVLIGIWWLAQLTWQLLTPGDQVVIAPVTGSVSQRASGPDIQAIQHLYIFGQALAEDEEQAVVDAPETTLNVRLVGIAASGNPLLSAAVIEQSGSQRTYIIGDRIGNSRATVESIFPDRVILDNGGRREALYIEGRDGSEAQLRVPSAPRQEPRQAQPSQTQSVQLADSEEVRQALSSVRENPSQLLEIINITQLRQDQQTIGFRLQPRQNQELFAAMGLQSGDIALAINGYDLTEPAQALAAMNELQDASSAVIRLRRGDQYIDLELQVP